MEEERVDILDEHGALTGASCLKAEAHRQGLPHPTVHIWFYTKDGCILFQRRAARKATFPNLWDIAVAGHVHSGETIMDAALREVAEEIGIAVTSDRLEKIGVQEDRKVHAEDFIDHEFHHVFLCELLEDLDSLVLQIEEVSAVALVDHTTFMQGVLKEKGPYDFVLGRTEYYAWVVAEINARCQNF